LKNDQTKIYLIKKESVGGINMKHFVVMGCSSFGLEATTYLIPKLRYQDSSILVVPHICIDDIYQQLQKQQVNLGIIEEGTPIEPGKVYIAMCRTYRGFDITSTHFRLNDSHWIGVDLAFGRAANAFEEKTIGVVLSGGGNDGSHGVKAIKSYDGRVLVQTGIIAGSDMPDNARKSVKVDFAGNLDELVIELNRMLK